MCEFILFLALFVGISMTIFVWIPMAIYHLCVLLAGLAAGALWICLHVLAFLLEGLPIALTLFLDGLAFGLEALTRGLEALTHWLEAWAAKNR